MVSLIVAGQGVVGEVHFVLAQFRPEGHGEVAEPNRLALFLELL